MKYFSFFDDEKALAYIEGSPIEDIDRLEKDLDIRIPEALREYLQLMGIISLSKQYDQHGSCNWTNQ